MNDCLRPSFLSYPPPRRLLLFEPPVYLQVSSVFINWTTWSKYTSEEFCMSHLLHRFSSSIGVYQNKWHSLTLCRLKSQYKYLFSPKYKTGICRYLLFLFYLKHLKTWAARYKWSLEAEGRTIISFLWSDGGTAEEKNCTNHREKIQQVGKLLPTEKDSCTARK